MTRAVSLTLLYDVFHSILDVILCQHFQKSFIFWKEIFPIHTTIYVVFQCYSFIYIIFHKLNLMFTIYVVCSLIISSHFSPYSFLCYLFDFFCNQIRISQRNCVVFANIHKLFTNNCIICFFRLPRAFFATMCPPGSRYCACGRYAFSSPIATTVLPAPPSLPRKRNRIPSVLFSLDDFVATHIIILFK